MRLPGRIPGTASDLRLEHADTLPQSGPRRGGLAVERGGEEAHRLRQAVKKGAQLSVVNPVDDDLLTRVHAKCIVAPSAMPAALAQIAKAAAQIKGRPVSAALAQVDVGPDAQAIAQSLTSGQRIGLFLGNLAAHQPSRAQLHALAALLADVAGARFGFFGEAGNSVGGYLAQSCPVSGRPGLNAREMLEQRRKAYILLHAEAELDIANPQLARAAMSAAECVVALSPYKHRALEYAQVLLPVAPFAETAGSFVNTEGRTQRFEAAARPQADARPVWKVLRVDGVWRLTYRDNPHGSNFALRAKLTINF